MAHVRLRGVTLDYPIFTSYTHTLRKDLYTRLGGKVAAYDRTVHIRALDGLSLDLEASDRLGVVGHNGAGKTTLLRVIAGVYPPQAGEIDISGRISSFTDITLGINIEATGWENIIFRCVFMGLTFTEARRLSPAIAEFLSELGEYLDMPVRAYSTGMFLRLAFAISTSVFPEIIIMDEMIGAGDAAFIEKAHRVGELVQRAQILVLASHSVSILRRFCNKILWLEKGKVRSYGTAEEVLPAYVDAQGGTSETAGRPQVPADQ